MDQTFNSSVANNSFWYWNNSTNNSSSDYYDDDQFLNNFTNYKPTKPLKDDHQQVNNAYEFLIIFSRFYLGVISFFGVLGNAFNVFSFVRAKRMMSSPSYYLAALALNDVIFLIVVLILWLKHFDLDLAFVNIRGVYQILYFINSTSSCISAWLVAAFTFERLIVVRYPLKRSIICTVRRAKWIIFWITFVACIIQAIALFTTETIDISLQMNDKISLVAHNITKDFDDGVISQSMTDSIDDEHHENCCDWNSICEQAKLIFNILEAGFTLVVPPVLIVIMNGLIIHGLAQYNKTFNSESCNINKHHRGRGRQVNIEMKSMRSSMEGTPTLQTNAVADTNHKHILKDDESQNNDTECILARSDSNRSTNQQEQQCFDGSPLSIVGKQSLIIPVLRSVTKNRSNFDDDAIAETIVSNTAKESGEGELDYSQQRVIGNESHDAFDIKRVETHHQLSMDAICKEETACNLSSESNNALVQTSNNAPVPKTATRKQNSSSASISLLNRHSGTDVNPLRSNESTEYNITKKLIIISTVHILLSIPSYVMHLKTFIDDNITFNTDSSTITFFLQQYLLMLYYTSFAINFLLYSTTSSTFRHQLFCCKNNNQSQRQVIV